MIELTGDAADGLDWAFVRLRVEGGRIDDAGGSGPGVRQLCRSLRGRTLLESAAVPAPRLAAEALAAAIGDAVSAEPSARRVAVAMSGGLDSAVALLRALELGLEPVGVTLRLWLDPRGPDTDRACCAPSAVEAARSLCHRLGLPHVTLDRREAFRGGVVRDFVSGYAHGETPNPCVACNGAFRFHELLACADRLGASRLATGHYARLVVHRGRRLVARGVDRAKDQSYMLGALDPSHLERLWFPLGSQTKDETRRRARAAGLPATARRESQDACFLAGADYREFLARQGLAAREGEIVDLDGRPVGRHDGFWRFTAGQRRGLAVSSSAGRLYAVRVEPQRNRVVVGPAGALERRHVAVPAGRLYVPVERAEAKLRYRSPGVAARVVPAPSGFELELAEPVAAVAPGQAAVLYEDDAVVGAGVIADAV